MLFPPMICLGEGLDMWPSVIRIGANDKINQMAVIFARLDAKSSS
jgi:hypothetical protein